MPGTHDNIVRTGRGEPTPDVNPRSIGREKSILDITHGERTTPTDSEIGQGNVMVYLKNGDLKYRAYGGTESSLDAADPGNVLGGTASASSGVAVHPNATVGSVTRGTAVGDGADADTADYGTAIGGYSAARALQATAVGYSAYVDAANGVAVGNDAMARAASNVAIGVNAISETGRYAVAVGRNAYTSGKYGVALGRQSDAGGLAAVALGNYANASAGGAVAIGDNTSMATANAGRIGVDQLVFGGTRDTVADASLNNGELTIELDETNGAFRIRGRDSGGTIREATLVW